MASGTVASWIIWENFTFSVLGVNANLWKILSSLSALTAIISPFLNYPKRLEIATLLLGKFTKIRNKYNHLWAQYEDEKLGDVNPYSMLREIQSEEEEAVIHEAQLPLDVKLRDKCYNEVNKLD